MQVDETFFDTYTSTITGISEFNARTLRYMLRFFNAPTEDCLKYWNETATLLKKLFQTKNDLLWMAGTIRVAFDGIFSSIIEPKEKVLVLVNGYWGGYVAEVVKAFNGIPIIIQEKAGLPIKPEKVTSALRKNRDVKAVSVMHVETDTGITNPVDEIGKAVKGESDALYVVDCATSLGGMEVKTDSWGADVCFSGSHKGLASPVGLAIIALGKKAWEAIEQRETPITGYYNSLLMWKERTIDRVPIKIAPPLPISVVHGIRARLDLIFKEGPDKIFRKHETAAKALRIGILAIGLKLLANCKKCEGCNSQKRICSNVVTTTKYPSKVDSAKVENISGRMYHIPILAAPYRPECFQLGTVNEIQVTPKYVLYLLTALGLTMSELGVRIKLEEGLKIANKTMLDQD